MSLYLPARAARGVLEQRRAEQAAVLQHVGMTEQLRYWNRELKQIDPYLELVKADDHARHPALKPGYYHVIRRPPSGIPSIFVHEGPEGEFREPDSGLFEELRRGDMWNAERQRDRERRIKAAKKSQERAEEREREARIDEITDRLRNKTNPHVSFAGLDVPR